MDRDHALCRNCRQVVRTDWTECAHCGVRSPVPRGLGAIVVPMVIVAAATLGGLWLMNGGMDGVRQAAGELAASVRTTDGKSPVVGATRTLTSSAPATTSSSDDAPSSIVRRVHVPEALRSVGAAATSATSNGAIARDTGRSAGQDDAPSSRDEAREARAAREAAARSAGAAPSAAAIEQRMVGASASRGLLDGVVQRQRARAPRPPDLGPGGRIGQQLQQLPRP